MSHISISRLFGSSLFSDCCSAIATDLLLLSRNISLFNPWSNNGPRIVYQNKIYRSCDVNSSFHCCACLFYLFCKTLRYLWHFTKVFVISYLNSLALLSSVCSAHLPPYLWNNFKVATGQNVLHIVGLSTSSIVCMQSLLTLWIILNKITQQMYDLLCHVEIAITGIKPIF